MGAFSVQIDVKKIEDRRVTCNLYTGSRCITILMAESDYKDLARDGFFIRSGKEMDSAGILNTTHVFIPQIEK